MAKLKAGNRSGSFDIHSSGALKQSFDYVIFEKEARGDIERMIHYCEGNEDVGERAVAKAYINCFEIDTQGLTVWEQWEQTREYFNNNKPFGRHKELVVAASYIISTDPRDGSTPEETLELARRWVERVFPDFEAAIYVHTDNTNHIPHAHILVNNTHLETGKRITTWRNTNPETGKRIVGQGRYGQSWVEGAEHVLQEICIEMGMTPLESYVHPDLPREAELARATPQQKNMRSLEELKITERRSFSWVADIRDRVMCAYLLSRNESDFVKECRVLGLKVDISQDRNRQGEYVFTHPERDTWKITGKSLGKDWTRWAIGYNLQTDMAKGAVRPSPLVIESLNTQLGELERINLDPHILGYTMNGELKALDVVRMLSVAEKYDIRSMDDFQALFHMPMTRAERSELRKAFEVALDLHAYPQARSIADGQRMPAEEKTALQVEDYLARREREESRREAAAQTAPVSDAPAQEEAQEL